MKKSVFFLVMIPALAFGSDVGGVREANFEAGAAVTDRDNAREIQADGRYTFGLSDYIASSISGDVGHTWGKGSYVDSNQAAIGIDLFARRFDFGKIGVGYSRTHYRFDSPVLNDSLNENTFSVSGEYYAGRFTLGGHRLTSRSDDFRDVHTWSISASAYLTRNTRARISGGGMDMSDNYGIGVEHQPAFWGNKASLAVGYSRSPDDDRISLSFNYFFGNTVSLKVRDRQYR